jgi:hypothetical protein
MKHAIKLALAALIVAAPAQAQASEWWLVEGALGDDRLTLADSASITASGAARTVRVADYWRNGRSAVRTVSIRCGRRTASELDRFVCRNDAYRMRTAMLVGQSTPDRFARIVFSVQTPVKVAAK